MRFILPRRFALAFNAMVLFQIGTLIAVQCVGQSRSESSQTPGKDVLVGPPVVQFPPFSRTYFLPNLLLQGGMTAETIQQLQGRGKASVSDGYSVGQAIPVGATVGQVNAFASYQRVLQPGNPDGIGPNPVGFYSRTVVGVDGATIWGANFNSTDVDADGTIHQRTTIFGIEDDCNVNHVSSAGACFFAAGEFHAQPTQLQAFRVERPIGGKGYKWSGGFQTDNGSILGAALNLGTQFPSDGPGNPDARTSSDSQYAQFVWRDAKGHESAATFRVDSNGQFRLAGVTGIAFDGALDISTGESHLSRGPYLDPASGLSAALKVYGGPASAGIATDSLVVTPSTPKRSNSKCIPNSSWDDDNFHYHCAGTGDHIRRVAFSDF